MADTFNVLSPTLQVPQTFQPQRLNATPSPQTQFQQPVTASASSQPTTTVQLAARQGKASGTQPFVTTEETPEWSAKTKQAILSGFQAGLKQYKLSDSDVSALLQQLGISSLNITTASIQDPANASEIKHIQEQINVRLNSPGKQQLGIAHKIKADGQIGKGTLEALVALRDAQRGGDVSIPVTPLIQQTRTGCYLTSEAMLFNALHGKDGTNEAYSEFDTRERVNVGNRTKLDFYAGVSSENAKGRITISHTSGLKMLDQIDAALNNKQPAILGVSYRKQDAGAEYNEGITDHYVLVNGRGHDADGVYYTFNDPAQGGQGKLYLEPISGKLSGVGDMAGIYDVTSASVYTDTAPETINHYKNLGKIVLYPGQRNDPDVSKAQFQLTKLGFDTKGIEGSYGDGTTKAVRAFQDKHKLSITGKIDTRTLAAIQADFTQLQKNNPTQIAFKRGESSPFIQDLQKKLNQAGFKTTETQGIFKTGTEKALKAFQTDRHINPSGNIDYQTWLALQAG